MKWYRTNGPRTVLTGAGMWNVFQLNGEREMLNECFAMWQAMKARLIQSRENAPLNQVQWAAKHTDETQAKA